MKKRRKFDSFFEMDKKRNVFCADFETRAGEKAESEAKTWVWAWALVNIDDIETVKIGTNIAGFINMFRFMPEGTTIVYFHNLKFDGVFILDYIIKEGYTFVEDSRQVRYRQYSCLIDGNGVYYSIVFSTGKSQRIEIRDSYKKLPFTVKKIGQDFKTKYKKLDLDYVLDRPEDYIMTDDEIEYIKNDVRVVAEAICTLYDDGMDKMTIGSDCMNTYQKMRGGKKKFRQYFPQLDEQQDLFVRKAYRGGWCYVNPIREGRTIHQNGSTFDVNSLYPSMMSSTVYQLHGETIQNAYPYGDGVYFTGEYVHDNKYPLYVIHIKATFIVKESTLPTIQLKGGSIFRSNEYITDSEGDQELYLTCIDFELFLRHYDVFELEYIDGYKYQSHIGFFDDYINRFMAQKMTEKGAKKQEAKLFLNNLYGKFAQKIKCDSKIPQIKDGDNKISYTRITQDDRIPIYVPVGAFCTAYSRRFTITAAQANYSVFCYADTDSIHIIGNTPVSIKIDDKLMCHWAHESDWTSARFVRQKTYAELINNIWDIKCAGMNQDSKAWFMEQITNGKMTIENFMVGLKITGKKLKPKVVEGGVILTATDFEIRGID